MNTRKEVESRTILLALTGSRAYGIYTDSSDYDYKGICIATESYYLGTKRFEQKNQGFGIEKDTCLFPQLNDTDSVIYDLKKYCELGLDNNPNILELLWIKDYIHLSKYGSALISIRNEFLCKKVKHTYLGYSYAQIKKAETHRKWMKKAVEDPNFYTVAPNPSDYGINGNPLRKEELNAFLEFLYILIKDAMEYNDIAEELAAKVDFKSALKQHNLRPEILECVQYYTRSTNDFISLLHATQTYNSALNEYNAYHAWMKNRNPERHAIEAQCGYDGKNFGHCFRLLKTGIEILKTGQLIVDRREAGDADYIKAIRHGQIPYDEVLAEVNRMKDEDIELAHQESSLPHSPNREAVEEVLIKLLKDYLNNA